MKLIIFIYNISDISKSTKWHSTDTTNNAFLISQVTCLTVPSAPMLFATQSNAQAAVISSVQSV